jgi:hypothetical protein
LPEDAFHSQRESMGHDEFEHSVLKFHPESSPVPPTSPAILLDEDRLLVRVEVWRRERPKPAAARRLLAPFLRRVEASCEVAVEEKREHRGFYVVVDIYHRPPRGGTVADVWRIGDEAQTLLQAAEGGELPRSVALDLFCAGRWDLFKGQPESDWLEAKGAPYDHLAGKLGKNWPYELAKDVAAFANSPEGGLIAIGLTTEDQGDGEVINGHREFDLSRVRGPTYRKYVAQMVYPRVIGFEVRRIEGAREDRGLAVLVIPPQSPSDRPFLVQGVISRGKALGSHVPWPVRREDDTALMDAAAIHARLRLGEQVIAGGKPARPGK